MLRFKIGIHGIMSVHILIRYLITVCTYCYALYMKHFKVTLSGRKNSRPLIQSFYTHALNKQDARQRSVLACAFEVPDEIIRWEVSEITHSVCPEC